MATASSNRCRILASRCTSLAFSTPFGLILRIVATSRWSISGGSSWRQASSSSYDSALRNPPNAVQVPPPPSWSVDELRLSSNADGGEIISNEELATLARRCLIDVRRLSPERRDRLRRHVTAIMRCTSALSDTRNVGGDDDSSEQKHGEGVFLTDEDIYDAPRGSYRTPVRGDSSHVRDWKWNESGESKALMQGKSIRSKMVKSKGGQEMFFSVVTKK